MRIHRVSITLIALIAIQLAFFAAVIIGERGQRLQEASKMAERMAETARSSTDDFFHRYLSIFDALKSVDPIRQQESIPANIILQRLNAKYSEIVNFAAVKQDGFFFASGKPMPENKVPNIKHLEFFQRILAGEKYVIMQPHHGPISKVLVSGIVVPLENEENKMNGLIGVSVEYQSLINRWNRLVSEPETILVVHDDKGKQIHLLNQMQFNGNGHFIDIPDDQMQRVAFGGKNFIRRTVRHLESGWRFSIFVPAYSGMMDLIVSRKDLIFLFSLMLITVLTLGIWFKQERKWISILSLEQGKLRQSEAKFRQLAENINAVFWISSPDKDSIIYVSPGFEKIWGKACQALYDTPWLWFESIHPDDRDHIQGAAISKQHNGTYDELYRIIREDKTMRWIHDRAFPISNADGTIYRIVGVAEDVTDRVEAQEALQRHEEELRAVVDNSIDAIAVSKQGAHKFVNKAYLNMFGYENAGELIGKPVFDLIDPDERTRISKFVSARSENQQIASNYQTKGLKKDGMTFDMEVNISQYGKPDDKKTLIILRDVTERNALERKLRQAQKMEAIGNLAGGIAHDFNNLLFPIIGRAEMLLDDLPRDSLEYENAREIFNAGIRAGDLVRQILAFSRRSEHQMMPVRIQTIITEVLKLCRATIPTNIDICENIEPDCGAVMADPSQIHQVVMNLMTNALHAVEGKNGTIDIQLKAVTLTAHDLPDSVLQPGQFMMLSVSDNGIGMSQTTIHNIFEPYFTTKVQGKGTGLGLAVVYGIVKEHNGEIKVRSQVGKGTTFTIYLPIMKKSPGNEPDHLMAGVQIGTERILLVDDEASVATLEGRMLERLGYQVSVKTSSADALNAFKTDPDSFDLVISDMTMPNMTGDQLAREILAIRPDTPIVICTGFSERINKEQDQMVGVKGVLMKPVVKSDLARMVRTVLDESQAALTDPIP